MRGVSHSELLDTFVYEADKGTLRKIKNGRKPYPWRGIGKELRYLAGCFCGKQYYLHHLVWFYHKGYLPVRIDHKDRDTRNNRIENLRECTLAQNQYNSKRKSNNKSGVKGVVPSRGYAAGKEWKAKITVRGTIIVLGYFADIEKAAEAYAQAARKYAGEFALTDSALDLI